MSNFQQNFLNSLSSGMQIGQSIKQQRDMGQVNRLAGQAASASGADRTGLLNQMYQINPTLAAQQETALGTIEDRRNKGMVNAARLITNAPESMRPALYQQMKPTLAQYGLQLPEQYDNTVAEAANALVQAYGGATGASGVQSTYIDADGNRVAIMRDGSTSVLGKNDLGANKQTVTMDINGVPTQVTFDRRTAGYEQAALGGSQQQPQAPQTGTRFTAPNGEVIDVSQIQDPHLRQQIINDPQGWGLAPDGSSTTLPQRNVTSMPTPIVGRTKEAEAAAVEQAKTNVQLGALPAELGMRSQAAINQAVGIEQGKSAAERQSNARAKAPQLLNVERGLTRINAALNGLEGMLVDTGPVDGMAMRFTEAGQELEAAVGAIQNDMLALTRVPGIGSQSDLEARIANLKYPSIYNHPSVNKRNTEQLIAFLSDLEKSLNASGQPANSGATQAQQQVQRARNPQTGEVVEYRNGQWVKVQ